MTNIEITTIFITKSSIFW